MCGCVVCQTKAHHIVVPFVMASSLFSNNDLPCTSDSVSCVVG